METLALLIHSSDRTSHMPWRAALISANAPQYSIEDTDFDIFLRLRRRKSYISATRNPAQCGK